MSRVSARTARGDWVNAGLQLLQQGGGDALTLDRLCTALGRTKGSFYHHFADIGSYHEALLGHWADTHTELPIADADSEANLEARRRALYLALRKADVGVELAVHAWALRSTTAQQALQRVHTRRLHYLQLLYGPSKGKRTNAADKALLEYATFIGALHLFPREADAAPRRKLMQSLRALLQGPEVPTGP